MAARDSRATVTQAENASACTSATASTASRAKFDETKLRIERGGDLAGHKKAVVEKVELEVAQVGHQKRELGRRERLPAEQLLTVQGLLDAWYAETMADNPPASPQAARRVFELHVLPGIGRVRVSEVKSEHLRKVMRAQTLATVIRCPPWR